MDKKNHLPRYGVGPIYVISIILLTTFADILSIIGILDTGKVDILRIPLFIFGIVLIILGIIFFIRAIFESRIGDNIENNQLVQTGAYAYVRNPIYSAFLMVCTGTLLLEGNLWLLILPVIFWLYMTILMKNTEEKWLTELYGEEYKKYCKRVNRCIPWFPKSKKQ